MRTKTIGELTDDEWLAQRCIAVDVDGTLIFWDNPRGPDHPGGTWMPNQLLIDRLIKWKVSDINRQLIIWSGNGREHAMRMVVLLGLLGVVDHVMSKPTFFLEDHPDWSDENTTVIDVREQWPSKETTDE